MVSTRREMNEQGTPFLRPVLGWEGEGYLVSFLGSVRGSGGEGALKMQVPGPGSAP